MTDGEKDLILILPKAFFTDAFLISRGTTANDFTEQNYYRFIANLIIEVSSALSENKNLAVTTSSAFNGFLEHLVEEDLALGSEELLKIFQGLIYIINDSSINKLGDLESMIAVGYRLHTSSDYEPAIIVRPSSRENYIDIATRYFGNSGSQNQTIIPLKLYDPREAKAFLEARFPKERDLVLERTPPQSRIFY